MLVSLEIRSKRYEKEAFQFDARSVAAALLRLDSTRPCQRSFTMKSIPTRIIFPPPAPPDQR